MTRASAPNRPPLSLSGEKDEMQMNKKDLTLMALADFLSESIRGIETGDIEGVSPLYSEMADEASEMGIFLPMRANIYNCAQTGKEFPQQLLALLEQYAEGIRDAARAS